MRSSLGMVKIPKNKSRMLEVVNFVDDKANEREARLNNEVIPLLEDGSYRANASSAETEKIFFQLQLDTFIGAIRKEIKEHSSAEEVPAMDATFQSLRKECGSFGQPTEHAPFQDIIACIKDEKYTGEWGPRQRPSPNDPAQLFDIVDKLADCARSAIEHPRYGLGAQSGHLFIVPDLSQTLTEGECMIKKNGTVMEGNVIIFRNPSYFQSDVICKRAVYSAAVEERMRVDNVIILPCNPELRQSAAEDMSGGDMDGDKATFFPQGDLLYCTGESLKERIPAKKPNTIKGCTSTKVRELLENGYSIGETCADILSRYEIGTLAIPNKTSEH